jgi:hypothetical protein
MCECFGSVCVLCLCMYVVVIYACCAFVCMWYPCMYGVVMYVCVLTMHVQKGQNTCHIQNPTCHTLVLADHQHVQITHKTDMHSYIIHQFNTYTAKSKQQHLLCCFLEALFRSIFMEFGLRLEQRLQKHAHMYTHIRTDSHIKACLYMYMHLFYIYTCFCTHVDPNTCKHRRPWEHCYPTLFC